MFERLFIIIPVSSRFFKPIICYKKIRYKFLPQKLWQNFCFEKNATKNVAKNFVQKI